MDESDRGLFWIMPNENRVRALAKSGRLTRPQLRERLADLPAPPDLLVFTPETQFPAWIVDLAGTGEGTIWHNLLDSIRGFWADSERITGRAIPFAGAAVNRAVASAYADPGSDGASGVHALPCASAIPESVFTSAVERARFLLRRDVPLLATAGDDEAIPHYVVLWDLRDDTVRAKIWK